MLLSAPWEAVLRTVSEGGRDGGRRHIQGNMGRLDWVRLLDWLLAPQPGLGLGQNWHVMHWIWLIKIKSAD